jgi:hypothetical protein
MSPVTRIEASKMKGIQFRLFNRTFRYPLSSYETRTLSTTLIITRRNKSYSESFSYSDPTQINNTQQTAQNTV